MNDFTLATSLSLRAIDILARIFVSHYLIIQFRKYEDLETGGNTGEDKFRFIKEFRIKTDDLVYNTFE
jgi:hypothetical protein